MSSIGSSAGTEARGHARLRLGTCPDSWGVWFADDPLQTPWERFLDEVAEVGYEWLELGPFGYLPTEAARLTEELSRRGLQVAGGTVHGFSGLHRPDDWPDIERITRQVAGLTAAVGGRHVIFVPVPGYRDDKTGAFLEPAELDAQQWRTMIRASDELGKIVAQADREVLAFGQAVAMGASCEPPSGEPAVEEVAKALEALDRDMFVVVEQDMYPTDFDKPKPIAQRTYHYLRGLGIGRD